MGDWVDIPIIVTAPAIGSNVVFANASMANDNDFLYLRFGLRAPAAPFSDYNTHLFVDTDTNPATGYHATAFSIGSEFMVESGLGYDERSGVFAGATLSELGWTLAPTGSGTIFELAISRQARFVDNSLVFTNPAVSLVLQDDRGSVMPAAGILYSFAWGGPYEDWRAAFFTAAQLTNPAISGDDADASGDGIPNLVKYAFDLNPLVVNHPTLPAGFLDTNTGTNFFDYQFVELNAPSGINYMPQVSSNLIVWDSTPANFIQVNSAVWSTNAALITLRLAEPVDAAAAQFVRLAIQRQ
jgi:hypothetical protein